MSDDALKMVRRLAEEKILDVSGAWLVEVLVDHDTRTMELRINGERTVLVKELCGQVLFNEKKGR